MTNEDERTIDSMPKISIEDRSLLKWRKPSEQDAGVEDAICIADGFGGQYAIQPDLDKFIVWMDGDAFSFKVFATVEKCKRYAECRFQHRVRKLFSKLKGGRSDD